MTNDEIYNGLGKLNKAIGKNSLISDEDKMYYSIIIGTLRDQLCSSDCPVVKEQKKSKSKCLDCPWHYIYVSVADPVLLFCLKSNRTIAVSKAMLDTEAPEWCPERKEFK